MARESENSRGGTLSQHIQSSTRRMSRRGVLHGSVATRGVSTQRHVASRRRGRRRQHVECSYIFWWDLFMAASFQHEESNNTR